MKESKTLEELLGNFNLRFRELIAYFGRITVNSSEIESYGFCVYTIQGLVKRETKEIGRGDGFANDVAEFHALINLMKYLNEIDEKFSVCRILSDSRTVINIVNEECKCKLPLKPLKAEFEVEFDKLIDKMMISIGWTPSTTNLAAHFLRGHPGIEYSHNSNKKIELECV